MNEIVTEWVDKAEDDFRVAQLALSAPGESLTDIVCFHCQQCAEKYLKSFLVEHRLRFQRTHALIELQHLCTTVAAEFTSLSPDLEELKDYAVEIRYPGLNTTLADAQNAVAAATRVRAFIRHKFGLT